MELFQEAGIFGVEIIRGGILQGWVWWVGIFRVGLFLEPSDHQSSKWIMKKPLDLYECLFIMKIINNLFPFPEWILIFCITIYSIEKTRIVRVSEIYSKIWIRSRFYIQYPTCVCTVEFENLIEIAILVSMDSVNVSLSTEAATGGAL